MNVITTLLIFLIAAACLYGLPSHYSYATFLAGVVIALWQWLFPESTADREQRIRAPSSDHPLHQPIVRLKKMAGKGR